MKKNKLILTLVGTAALFTAATTLYHAYSNSASEEAIVIEPTKDLVSQETTEEQKKVVITEEPIEEPTLAPTTVPTKAPTQESNKVPTTAPTKAPTKEPTKAPTAAPTVTPTKAPTAAPTVAPTKAPTVAPTKAPTQAPTPAPTKVPTLNPTAPNFTVQTANGSSVRLGSFFGKPIVINFWASWCSPCKTEMPAFQNVYQDYKNDVVFLMVDMVDGRRETKESGSAYVSSQGFTFPVYYDVNQSAAYAYAVTSYPTTVFITADGDVAHTSKGSMSEGTLRSNIETYLR